MSEDQSRPTQPQAPATKPTTEAEIKSPAESELIEAEINEAKFAKETAKADQRLAEKASGKSRIGDPTYTSSLKIPQGIAEEKFKEATKLIKEKVKDISNDIFVQGSRAKGTATATSDIDFGIRVSAEKFDMLIKECFGKPNSGSAAERTMLHAIKTGKIHYGEIRINGNKLGNLFKEQIQNLLEISDIDLSIIKSGGPFDSGPFIYL